MFLLIFIVIVELYVLNSMVVDVIYLYCETKDFFFQKKMNYKLSVLPTTKLAWKSQCTFNIHKLKSNVL